MTSDDYEFAAKEFASGSDMLSYVLYYGNGRLLGNISAIAMVNFPTAAIIIKALAVASVVFLLPAVLGLKQTGAYVLSFLLFLGINDDVFGEVYTWTSGFGNYLPPIWITLLILYLILLYPDVKSRLIKGLMCGTVLVLGVAGQLYVEHTTVINILLSCLLAAKELFSKKKDRAVICFIWAVAAVIGAGVIFAIPKVFYLEHNRSEGYRSVHTTSLLAIAFSAVKNTMRFAVGYLGMMGSVICGGGLMTTFLTKEKRHQKWNNLFFWICAVSLAYQLFSVGASAEKWHGQLAVLHHIVSTIMVIPPLFVWILAAVKLESKDLRLKTLSILALAFASLGVLLIVSPVPSRVIFQSYVFIVAAFLMIFREVSDILPETVKKHLFKGLCVAMAVLVLVLSCVFWNIHHIHQVRNRHMADAIARGDTFVEFCRIPYDYIFWENEMGLTYYYYRNEPGDLGMCAIDFDTWCSLYLNKITLE